MMSPGVRRFALTAHVCCSVGWLGAVVAFLVLAIAGLSTGSPDRARAAYIAMAIIGWNAIVPLCLTSMIAGIVQSLGTSWGLFRHYWVLAKLLITLVATLLLLLHMGPIDYAAELALDARVLNEDQAQLRGQLVWDASLALVALIAATVLSVYKPAGLTRYGWRKQFAERANQAN